MALAAQPATHGNWGRWPQQVPGEFNMMDTPGFMPYDTRHGAAPQMQRPLQTQYVVNAPYTAAPMNTIGAPQYQQHQAFSYVPYQSPPPSTPVGSPFRQEYQDRPYQLDQSRMMPFKRDLLHSPASTRRTSVASIRSTSTNPNAAAKTITYNETINPSDRVNFETDIDELMKAIQTKEDEKAMTQGPTPVATPRADGSVDGSSPPPCDGESILADNKPKKKWVCDGPACNKSFIQKTHLDIHRRTHTGAKPYVCF